MPGEGDRKLGCNHSVGGECKNLIKAFVDGWMNVSTITLPQLGKPQVKLSQTKVKIGTEEQDRICFTKY